MKKFGVFLQPFTILLTAILLVLIIIDLYSYEWNTDNEGNINKSGRLSYCTPWSIHRCSDLWKDMGIRHKVGLILHVCLIPLTIVLILISSLAIFTRVIRKQTAIIILIFDSWLVLFTLIATQNWQIYITLASLLVSFIITQIFAFCGYFRPLITMLSFEGHYQRYDYPRTNKLTKNMVSVKELDNF